MPLHAWLGVQVRMRLCIYLGVFLCMQRAGVPVHESIYTFSCAIPRIVVTQKQLCM